MSVPAIVWLAVALGGTGLLAVFAVALVRHGLVLGRAASRFTREASPEIEAISAAGRGREGRR